MDPIPLPHPASPVWVHVFLLFSYPLALGCIHHALRVGVMEWKETAELGYPRRARALAAVTQPAVFAIFVALFWALESWAHFRTPFYLYDAGFPDLIPRLPYHELLGDWLEPVYQPCSAFVRDLMEGEEAYRRIPLAIPLLEASLTYAAMWIAFLLGTGYKVAPLLAALLMVNVDAMLDPVVAVTHTCDGEVQGGGLGLWHWYSQGAAGAGDIALWFGVPLFNYAAWWAAPVICISFVVVMQYLRYRLIPRYRSRPDRPHAPEGFDALVGGAMGTMLVAGFILFLLAPNKTSNLPGLVQWGVMVAAIGVSGFMVHQRIGRHGLQRQDKADPGLTRPVYLFLLLGVAVLLLEGIFLELPGLIVVAVVTLMVGSLITWSPYPGTIRLFFQRLLDVDRFMRLHYLGFAFMLVLLGALAFGVQRVTPLGEPSSYQLLLGKWEIGTLLGIALAYHIWGFLLNDVVDLPIDRHQPNRRRDPLVRGRIQRGEALAIALTAPPAALGLAFLLPAPPRAHAILVLGMALMLGYNLLGKRLPFPILTDALQAAAWACLAWFAAQAVAPSVAAELVGRGLVPPEPFGLTLEALRERVAAEPSLVLHSDQWLLVGAIASWGGGFILLINGIHGGLRDLANDSARKAHNTARLLGARVEAGQVVSNYRIVGFAYLVHLAMFVMPTLVLVSELPLGEGRVGAMLALYGLGGVSLVMLWLVVRPREPRRDHWIGWHLLVLLLPAVAAFIPFLEPSGIYLLVTAFTVPLLAQPQVVHAFLRHVHPAIADDALEPPPAPADLTPPRP